MLSKKHRPAPRPPPLKGFPRKAVLELNLNREVGVWVTVTWEKRASATQGGRWVEKRAQERLSQWLLYIWVVWHEEQKFRPCREGK